jgi:hypothetical protein
VGDILPPHRRDRNTYSLHSPIASQLNRAIERVKKPDHWPRDFAKSVKERQTAVLEELKLKSHMMWVRSLALLHLPQNTTNGPASTTGQQQFISQFRNVIATALAPVGTEFPSASHPLQITHVTATGQPLYRKSCVLLEESKNLIAQYGQLAHQCSDTSRLEDLAKGFAADKDQAAQAISAGRRVADTDIDDMLADGLHEVRGRKATTADDEMLGREILQIGRNQHPDLPPLDTEAWGKVAYRAQRAVEKLYNVAVVGE